MREPAPPYVGEGPHALWHVSENAAIERFEPHVSATAASYEPRVWAVDTRHLPLYWFPRECPRGTFWATSGTTPQDAELLAGASRVHLVETSWLERMRAPVSLRTACPRRHSRPTPRSAATGSAGLRRAARGRRAR